jgi:elongation factor P
MASYTDIRKGSVIMYQGAPHFVMETDHRTPGRRAAFMQVGLRNLKTGSSFIVKFSTGDVVEFCHTETIDVEYSYEDDQGYHFTDPKTYDDIVLSSAVIGDKKKYLAFNAKYTLLSIDGKPSNLELPASIVLKVEESPDAIKGDSVSNVQKAVTMESGLVVKVPLFISKGELLRINTEDGSYLGRA